MLFVRFDRLINKHSFAEYAKPTGKMTITQRRAMHNRQRRMGVEPTEDRAERPPSRFEDGETHRGPYTSISFRMPYFAMSLLSCQANLSHLNISPLACFCTLWYTNKRGTTSSPYKVSVPIC